MNAINPPSLKIHSLNCVNITPFTEIKQLVKRLLFNNNMICIVKIFYSTEIL